MKGRGGSLTVPAVAPLLVRSLSAPTFRHETSWNTVKRILDGEVFCLGARLEDVRRCEAGFGQVFSSDISVSRVPCDIREVWEAGRLQHVSILVAWLQQNGNHPKAPLVREFAREAVVRWISVNPFLFGPHYLSAMECGLRVPVFFYALKFLLDPESREFATILEAVYHHAWWIEKRLSLYSSLGNHTVGECIGLVFAGAMFKGAPEGRRWLERGVQILVHELERQVLPDGGPVEQSLNYHRFVLDSYWLAVEFLEANNIRNCSDIKSRLMLGEDFLTTFRDSGGALPAIGDCDDGHAIAPGIAPKRITQAYREKRCRVFPASGYTVVRGSNQVLLTFDHGPLGMPPLHNHGHADALSLTLSIAGSQILVDPGTYRYNGEPELRSYFKGTRAHNTVTVDGLDQAVQETGFIWSRPFSSKFLERKDIHGGIIIAAAHDGYERLPEPVRHTRTILFFDGKHFLVRDCFTGKGVHEFELNFHLHPEATVERLGGWWRITRHEAELYMIAHAPDELTLVQGGGNPRLGWYSPAYGAMVASGALHCAKKGVPREVVFLTAMCTGAPVDSRTLEEKRSRLCEIV